jgi:hypothetical protein
MRTNKFCRCEMRVVDFYFNVATAEGLLGGCAGGVLFYCHHANGIIIAL